MNVAPEFSKKAIGTGSIDRACVLYHHGVVCAEASADGIGFHPVGYPSDDGQINEQEDVQKYLRLGKIPPTGLRFFGKKFSVESTTPGREMVITGSGNGLEIIFVVTSKHIFVGQCIPGRGQSVGAMHAFVTEQAKLSNL